MAVFTYGMCFEYVLSQIRLSNRLKGEQLRDKNFFTLVLSFLLFDIFVDL